MGVGVSERGVFVNVAVTAGETVGVDVVVMAVAVVVFVGVHHVVVPVRVHVGRPQ